MIGYDPRASDLIDALKSDRENFILSNHIFQKKSALRAVYEFYRLKAELFEFARDPNSGFAQLGPHPKPPNDSDMENASEEEKSAILSDYAILRKEWEDKRRALEMHVPYPDLIMIERFLEPFQRTFAATSAYKGLRFKAFTKDVEHPEQSALGGLLKRGQQ
jgi:hypothetical protein